MTKEEFKKLFKTEIEEKIIKKIEELEKEYTREDKLYYANWRIGGTIEKGDDTKESWEHYRKAEMISLEIKTLEELINYAAIARTKAASHQEIEE